MNPYAHVLRQQDDRMPNATPYVGVEILFPVSGEVGNDLARTHFDFKPGQREIACFHLTPAGAHIDAEFHGYVVTQAKVPVVLGMANVELSPRLGSSSWPPRVDTW